MPGLPAGLCPLHLACVLPKRLPLPPRPLQRQAPHTLRNTDGTEDEEHKHMLSSEENEELLEEFVLIS